MSIPKCQAEALAPGNHRESRQQLNQSTSGCCSSTKPDTPPCPLCRSQSHSRSDSAREVAIEAQTPTSDTVPRRPPHIPNRKGRGRAQLSTPSLDLLRASDHDHDDDDGEARKPTRYGGRRPSRFVGRCMLQSVTRSGRAQSRVGRLSAQLESVDRLFRSDGVVSSPPPPDTERRLGRSKVMQIDRGKRGVDDDDSDGLLVGIGAWAKGGSRGLRM